MNKIVLITGATSGFGKACAEKFAASGSYKLILTGRRKDRLEALATTLAPVPVFSLVFDVQDRSAVDEAIAKLPPEWQKKAETEFLKFAGPGKGRTVYPEKINFATYTLKYPKCNWLTIQIFFRLKQLSSLARAWAGCFCRASMRARL